ncbi:MAG: J domain-containing protein [Novosphingobium sp.]
MIKFLWLIAIAVFAWRLFVGRWPWESGKIVARQRAETQARNLLGVRRGAARDEIIEAHRRLITQVHPDRGGTAGQVHEANDARDVLLAGLSPDKTEA